MTCNAKKRSKSNDKSKKENGNEGKMMERVKKGNEHRGELLGREKGAKWQS